MLEERLSSYQDSVSMKNYLDDDTYSVSSGVSSFYNYQNLKCKSLKKNKDSFLSKQPPNQNIIITDLGNGSPERKRPRSKLSNMSPRITYRGKNNLIHSNTQEEIPEVAEDKSSRRNSLHTYFTSNEEKQKITAFYSKFKTTMKDTQKTKLLLEDTIEKQKIERKQSPDQILN